MRLRSYSLLAALGFVATTAHAATDNACWNRGVERLDYYLNPPEKGDNAFFTGISNQSDSTNVVLLYPTTASMKEFTQKLYRIRVDLGGATPTGCGNAYLNNLLYFIPTNVPAPASPISLEGPYSAARTYPDPGKTFTSTEGVKYTDGYSGGSGQSDGLTAGKAYRYLNWPANNSVAGQTVATACSDASASNAVPATSAAACVACLGTNGYWLNPEAADNDVSTSAGVFSTNWLRFHPPKWTLLSLAYKRLVNGPLLSVLREGVMVMNGTRGGDISNSIGQTMLPQACQGVGRPMNQKLGAIDNLTYTSAAHPLAELLFNAGYFMGGGTDNSPWIFTSASTLPTFTHAGKSGPCNGCSGDFIVLFSDGRGDTANPSCTRVSGVLPPQCTAEQQCSTLGMGAEDDGNDFLDPSIVGGAGTAITASGSRETPNGTCDMDFADDVSRWMTFTNMKPGTPSTITTFVVAIGDPNNTYGEMNTLQQIAEGGGGRYVVSDDFADLERQIEIVLQTIITRATSFSAAAITAVQTRGSTSAFIPRFRPADGNQWNGSLLRYNLYNEFSAGCTSANYGVKDSVFNPNGDTSCYDLYLRDNNDDFVAENSNGDFVLVDTSVAYDGGWPIKHRTDGGEYASVPIWEAGAVLTSRVNNVIAGGGAAERRIFTASDNGAGGYNSTVIPFTVANVANITPLLKLGGATGDFCSTLASRSRTAAYSTEDECATDVIKFMQGRDILLQNPYNRTLPRPAVQKARPNLFPDIFHSTPVLVTPPVPTFICDLGIANQCVASLYLQSLTPGGSAAYQTYFANNQYRTEITIVGSNDGMLHAFNAGNDTVSGSVHSFDLGSGDEVWAFIPPDMMPKLMRYVIGERHEMLLDGTPMVRDIWVDGSGATGADYVKQYDEFHTLAVVGEREGGRHYFALDITDYNTPKFLWSWPPPGTPEGMNEGESWNDLGPGASPIGPVAVYDSSGPLTVSGDKAAEKYVVALGGGYDPAYLRGRAIYMIDAYTGAQLYRFSSVDSIDATDPRSKLFPVAAPVSMLDLDSDGLFDTASVGDTGGQVWTLSMAKAGRDTDADGRYDNWFGARSFSQFKGLAFYKRSPFFQKLSAAAMTGGGVRLFLGSGDRDQIKDANGGTCGLANLNACNRKNCAVSVKSTPSPAKYSIGSHDSAGSWVTTVSGLEPTMSFSTDGTSQSAACTDVASGELDFTITCGGTTETYSSQVSCDWGATGAECPVDTGRLMGTSLAYTPAVTMEDSRFYAIQLFDSGSRMAFTTAVGALAYDTARLTETDLVDASLATTTATGNGWWVKHDYSVDEKTASSALILGGCVLWNTLKPNLVSTTTCGGTIPLDTAYTYQGDAVTGSIACGTPGSASANATVRAVARTTYIAPQQPSPVISVNPVSGQVMYGGVSIEPGAPPVSITVGTSDVISNIHWLEVPRKLHDCRHGGTNCN